MPGPCLEVSWTARSIMNQPQLPAQATNHRPQPTRIGGGKGTSRLVALGGINFSPPCLAEALRRSKNGGGKGTSRLVALGGINFSPPCLAEALRRSKNGGGKGTRTPDLLHAKQLLSQLSYTPNFWR